MILELLKEPFPTDRIHWRVGATNQEKTKGIALAYVDARDVMDRLDEVMGDNWQCRHPFEGCCEIGLKINGEWLWRANGAGKTDVEGEKGQYSDAFKRAAVMWGISRYLYSLPNEWVDIKPSGRSYKLAITPKLPDWATPFSKELKKAIEEHQDSILAIKDGIRDGNLSSAAEAWFELSKEDMASIFVAPSRGGPFTTQEREIMRSKVFREAHFGVENDG